MLNTDELSLWVAANYPLSRPIACQLLRSYTNDVYSVLCPDTGYILKVYGHPWRTETEVRYEIALLQHLAARGMRTAPPVASKDGDFVKQFMTVNGNYRQAVLFTRAPGEKPKPPFTPSLYVAFGKAVAQMHTHSLDFSTVHTRRPLDMDCLIDEPLQLIVPLLQQSEERAFLTDLADRVRDRIGAFVSAGLEWGPIHNDATLDNLHLTADGDVVLFDFDSGGPGWRAADLQGWTVTDPAYAEKGEAFQSGYSGVRSLEMLDIQAAPTLTLATDIWGLKIDLENRVLAQGAERTQVYLRDQLSRLRERERQISIP
jgi:Ser/Thr protein kinase RdoA (MazF antagonist)